jgi:CRISPR-associated protein (TIGR02710 family)
MKRALILTVGTGTRMETNIVKPLLKTIHNSHPDYLVFIASEASKQYAEEIVRELTWDEERFRIVKLRFPDDIQHIFAEINKVIREVIQKGFQPKDVEIDFTSGTKAMTGGAVLSAIFHSCGSLKYIIGERKNGIVLDGAEKFLTITPESIFALQELNLVTRFILELRFEPALRLLATININLLDDYQQLLLENLTNIAQGYNCWEVFDHKKFSGYYGKVDFTQPELLSFRVGKEISQRLVNISKALQEGNLSEDTLVDIFNNAKRRLDEGKYDDALSRLYRLVEMLGQWELSNPPIGIKTSDVDIRRIPEEKRKVYENLRDDDGKIQIGLKKSYELLALFKSPIAEIFLKDGKIKALLNKRNFSILAHGTKPISREDCTSLFESIKSILTMKIPNFTQKSQELDFPWRVKGK